MERHTDFMLETARLAGAIQLRGFRSKLRIQEKSDLSLVTEVDLASEAAIVERIRARFPDDLLVTEENQASHDIHRLIEDEQNEGRHVWIIDPLDGTSNYANGFGYFNVSIGRGQIQQKRLELTEACVFAPKLDELFYAARGQGATLNGAPIQVRPPRDFPTAFLVTGFGYHRGDLLNSDINAFRSVAHECQTIRRTGAAALDLAYTAMGVFDAFWESGLKPWDSAAGALIVREAGGKVLDYEGQFYDVRRRDLVAGSGEIVDRLVKLIYDK